MLRRGVRNLVAVALAAGGASVSDAASFIPLGDMPGDPYNSRAFDVSSAEPNGPTVVGYGYPLGLGTHQAFRWTSSEGMVPIPTLSLTGQYYWGAWANGVSGRGSVIAGRAGNGEDQLEAFRWTPSEGTVGLGNISRDPDTNGSTALAVSADGSVIVGESTVDTGHDYRGSEPQAFRWSFAGGMVGLGDLPGGEVTSTASDVSADGSVIVGSSSGASGTEAFRWTEAEGMVGLGDLPGGSFGSTAGAVSADGSVVFGSSQGPDGREAFRWTALDGMVGLGDLPGGAFSSGGVSVTADGSVVVGNSSGASGSFEMFIWDQTHGMRSLLEVLQSEHGLDLTGWTSLGATAISDDGLSIVGYGRNPNGDSEAWLVSGIPEPSSLALLVLGLLGLGVARRSA